MSRFAKTAAAILGAGALLTATAGVSTAAAPPPLAPAPSAATLVQALDAMLKVTFDKPLLTGPADKATFRNGFLVPPGGQDPYPVCLHAGGSRVVSVPDTLAVGYFAENGNINQTVYDYPTAEAGQAAWSRLSAAIDKKCKGSWTDESGTSTVERSRLSADGAAGAGWSVTTRTPYNVLHVAVRPVDGDIQVLTYSRQSPTIRPAVPAAVDALSTRLALEWSVRATKPASSLAMTTWIVPAMLQSADVPQALPVTAPEDGGVSSFMSQAPGNGPRTCRANGIAGSWSYWSTRGGSGDITAEPGELDQNVEQYQSLDAASQAWRKLRAAILRCGDERDASPVRLNAVDRTTTGVSDISYGGVPGVWLREFSTYPEAGLSVKSYTIYLLVEGTIQSLTYYESREKVGQIPLDQGAVDGLATLLADRWAAAQSS